MNILTNNFCIEHNNINIDSENIDSGIIDSENIYNDNKNTTDIIVEKKDVKVKKLLSIINSIKLNKEQYIEIYKIIKTDNNIKIMTNKNGVFIDLQYLDKLVLDKLELFIHYITTNELSQNNI